MVYSTVTGFLFFVVLIDVSDIASYRGSYVAPTTVAVHNTNIKAKLRRMVEKKESSFRQEYGK